MTSFANLPLDTLKKIRQHLNFTQLVYVGQTCEYFQELFTPLAWTSIGYCPRGYTMKGKYFRLQRFTNQLRDLYGQSLPEIPNDILSGRAIEMDKLTFLLMNNLISDRTLSRITTVTICAGYSVGCATPDRKRKWTPSTPSSSSEQFSNERNAQALFDTAILEIFAHRPNINEGTLEAYTQLFADIGLLQAWSITLIQAILSIQKTRTFASAFLQGRQLRVGLKQSVTPANWSINFGYAKALATNRFSFAEFIATKLLLLPNLINLAIDAFWDFGVDVDNAHTIALCSARTESLLTNIAMVLPRLLPDIVLGLSIHGRLLHESFLSTNIGDLSKLKVVRFECYDNGDHYLHGTSFMKMLKARSRLEKLEIVTTNDPKGGDPTLNGTLHASIALLAQPFVQEIADLPLGGTATNLAFCSQYLTSMFTVVPIMNQRFRVIRYTIDLRHGSQIEDIRAMFGSACPVLEVLKFFSATKYELDVPGITEIGLVNLKFLELCNFTFGPEVTKLLNERPGLEISQWMA